MKVESKSETDSSKTNGWRRAAPVLGCGVGGCLLPILFLLFCAAVFHDIGGPLFWPMLAMPLAVIGFLVGCGIRAKGRARKDEGS